MKQLILLITLFTVLVSSASEVRIIEKPKVVASLSVKNFKYIETAKKELCKRKLNSEEYEIILMKIGNEYSVIFQDPERITFENGHSNTLPTFSVTLDEHYNVLSSGMNR